MSFVLLASIAIRLAALVWSILLLWRLREWRMAFLSLMLALMATRQTLTLTLRGPGDVLLSPGSMVELPGLFVSVIALLAVGYLSGIFREQRETVEKLSESEERLRRITENMPVMMGALDENGVILAWNREAERVTGYSAQELIGNPAGLKLIYPDEEYRARLVQQMRERGHDYRDWEWELVCKDGTVRTIAWSNVSAICPIPGWWTWGIGVDVTERKQVEQTLRTSQERLKFIHEQLPAILWTTDRDLQFTSSTGLGLKELDLKPGQVVGLSLYDFFQTDDPTFQPIADHLRALEGKSISYEFEWQERLFDTRIEPFRDEAGNIVGTIGIAYDITDAKAAEQELAQEKEFTDHLIESLPGLFYLIREDGRVIQWNRLAEEVTGYSGEEIAQMHPLDFVAKEERLETAQRLQESFETGGTTTETIVATKEGQRIPMLFKSLRLEMDSQRYLVGLGIDITDRKQMEEALRESERFSQKIFDTNPNVLYIFDVHENRNVYINRSVAEVVGYSQEELLDGEPVLPRLMHPEDLERMGDYLQQVQASSENEIFSFEYRMRHRDGTWRWFLSRDTIFRRDPEGNVEQIIGTAIDITDRKRIEEALRRSETRLRVLVNQLPAVLWTTDQEHRYTFAVGRGLSRLQIAPDDLIGKSVGTALDELDRAELIAAHHEAFSGEPQALVVEWKGLSYEIHVEPLHGEERIVGCIGVALDVTEREEAEEAARQVQRELLRREQQEREQVGRELERVREQLVRQTRLAAIGQISASIAHELRNPLGVIRNALYYLNRRVPKDQPKVAEYFDIMEQELTTSERIISDLMEMSRSRPPVKAAFNVVPVVRELVEKAKDASGINWNLAGCPECFEVQGDEGQIRQVLHNIIGNAVQAMDGNGTVSISCERDEEVDEIVVADEGPGIREEKLTEIFEPLYTTKAKGTGLGLTICRQIMQHHEGAIQVASVPGEGAEFRVQLPRHPATESQTREGEYEQVDHEQVDSHPGR